MCWYPEVPAVMDTRQLSDLLHTNEQIIRPGSERESFRLTASRTATMRHPEARKVGVSTTVHF